MKRWTSEEQILTAIQTERNRQIQWRAEAHRLKDEYQRIVRLINDPETANDIIEVEGGSFNGLKQEYENLFKRADNKEERIRELGHKLAAFRTEIFAFTEDRAVV